MRKLARFLVGGILPLLVAVSILAGCTGGSGTSGGGGGGGSLVGQVRDADSLVALRNVRIALGATLATTTDTLGNFALTGVPAGRHTLVASRDQYHAEEVEVLVAGGESTRADVEMDSSRDDWLAAGTTYRWQVEVVHPDSSTTAGPEWSFTTESAGPARQVAVTEAVDEAAARRVAEGFLASKAGATHSLASAEGVTGPEGSTLAWLFHLSPRGHVIVPATRANTPPILSWSLDSSLAAGAPGRQAFLDMVRVDVRSRLAAFQDGARLPEEAARRHEARWEAWLAGTVPPEDLSAKVYGPLCWDPTWNQTTPYNDRCPQDPDPNYPGRCVVGCVATAFSQVFNYWLSPTNFTFTARDSYTTETRSIAIDATTANFTGINYNNGKPDDDTVAKVSFAAGVLARMDYTSESSGAYTLDVGKALANRWGFGAVKDLRFEPDDTFDSTALVANLTATTGRPVVMAIRKYDYARKRSRGGHAIVVDGYDSATGNFHLNMGWAGSSDGWYSLPTGMPSSYNYIAGYIYDMAPQNGSALKATPTAAGPIPANEFPQSGDIDVPLDEPLDWDECDNADHYRCYLWKAGEAKPTQPTFPDLPYPVAGPGWD